VFTVSIDASMMRVVRAGIIADAARYRGRIKDRLRKAGNVVRQQMRRTVHGTYGPDEDTGTLKRHIRIRMQREPRKYQRFGSIDRGLGETQWDVLIGTTPGGNAFYGKFFEFGVASRTTKSGANRGTLNALPWMGPALNDKLDEVNRILSTSFDPLAR
jgi:hypothetical protein